MWEAVKEGIPQAIILQYAREHSDIYKAGYSKLQQNKMAKALPFTDKTIRGYIEELTGRKLLNRHHKYPKYFAVTSVKEPSEEEKRRELIRAFVASSQAGSTEPKEAA
jgi:hypothetical protein